MNFFLVKNTLGERERVKPSRLGPRRSLGNYKGNPHG